MEPEKEWNGNIFLMSFRNCRRNILSFLFEMFMYGRFLKSRKKWKRVFLQWESVISESRVSRWTFVLILEVDEFSITASDVPSKCSFESVLICFLLSEMRICFSLSDVWTCVSRYTWYMFRLLRFCEICHV